MNRSLLAYVFLTFAGYGVADAQRPDPVSFSQVHITDSFWRPKMDKVSTVTLEACMDQTEIRTPRIRNFEKVARHKGEQHEGIFYDDSDVFKALEAIAYSLRNRGDARTGAKTDATVGTKVDVGRGDAKADAKMEARADSWIDKIAAAQLPDGYLNTYFTLRGLDKRWTDMSMHEDYNGGHLIEAGVAYYDATGKRKLLDVAIRWANHFDSLFGPGKRDWVTGHQELELALVKLYRTTHQDKYLRLAHWLLDERGHRLAKGYTWTDWKDTAYAQDLVPIKEQKRITGHAVRAMYMYTGAADVAKYTGDAGYLDAMKTVWSDVVDRNMYITGGIGSSGSNEGFSTDYDLPNEQAYCETCASVGMVFWNQRMNSLTGEGQYIDVLEKSLYNGALDGLSLSGDRFFYGNPLASTGNYGRREWFGTACCPANIARLVASLGNYIYGKSESDIWINLFVGSNTTISMGSTDVALQMKTDYPWSGRVALVTLPERKIRYALHVRIPGWARGFASTGGLYQYADADIQPFTITVNGRPAGYTLEKGYAVIDRSWKRGDRVELNLPMDIRRVEAGSQVKADKGRVALQRGPLIYCVEGADNDGQAWNILLPDAANFSAVRDTILSEPVIALTGTLPVVTVSADGYNVRTEQKRVTAIPYYTWCNRGNDAMQVWLPRKITDIKIDY